VCAYYQQQKGNTLGVDIAATKCPMYKDKSRIVELPCKVGDTVYVLDEYRIAKSTINTIEVGGENKLYYEALCYASNADEPEELIDAFDLEDEDFGKTVFLAKEAAEQALKESENNG
jgi:hypothetical protein